MKIPGAADRIDDATFEQILEMDDDEEERDFSKSIVYDFFTQAESTFGKMDSNLQAKDLKTLSELGHFLKGSSATLGLTKVKDECEKIQHYGQKKDATGTKDLSSDDALSSLQTAIDQAKKEFKDVEKVLKRFYHDDSSPTRHQFCTPNQEIPHHDSIHLLPH
ncbi:hpt domain-containing protein [Polyplosphaeria fusca]|uniref:Hpt domain-containing protein n=1 Tax=Polyplosphaeria fusca TaxID=682080 RepID=A0A9P4QT80_9PLEO|nr:hpt domain-containing protein [Polyplosphaeria fusca]